jgi:hypothetical protein
VRSGRSFAFAWSCSVCLPPDRERFVQASSRSTPSCLGSCVVVCFAPRAAQSLAAAATQVQGCELPTQVLPFARHFFSSFPPQIVSRCGLAACVQLSIAPLLAQARISQALTTEESIPRRGAAHPLATSRFNGCRKLPLCKLCHTIGGLSCEALCLPLARSAFCAKRQ